MEMEIWGLMNLIVKTVTLKKYLNGPKTKYFFLSFFFICGKNMSLRAFVRFTWKLGFMQAEFISVIKHQASNI